MVVPIFAPMIIETACFNFSTPELTNATTMTVVAEEDWMTAVTPAPSSTPLSLLDTNRSNRLSIFPPETTFNPSPNIDMPKSSILKPPNNSK